MDFASLFMSQDDQDVSRKAYNLRNSIIKFQESFSVIEKCPQPVIAAIHSACVGGGVDMVCACDIRWCTSDAWFQVKVNNPTENLGQDFYDLEQGIFNFIIV